MRRSVALCYLACAAIFTGIVVYVFTRAPGDTTPGNRQGIAAGTLQYDDTEPTHIGVLNRPPLPKLPETDPPAGLPIQAWGPRDCLPVIRDPWYVSAQQGDSLLAADEPVLGVVVDWQAKAYSTNQLNDHEMVLDLIAGTPVLVSY